MKNADNENGVLKRTIELLTRSRAPPEFLGGFRTLGILHSLIQQLLQFGGHHDFEATPVNPMLSQSFLNDVTAPGITASSNQGFDIILKVLWQVNIHEVTLTTMTNAVNSGSDC
jgi:hypothetical protein